MAKGIYVGVNTPQYADDGKTLLLIHGDNFADDSPKRVPIENNGVQISTSQSKFGGKSLYFDGSSNLFLQSEELKCKNGDFTVDWWEYRMNNGTTITMDMLEPISAGFASFILNTTDNKYLLSTYSGGNWDTMVSDAFPSILNEWVHFAVVKNGTTIKIYKNGVSYKTATVTNSYVGGSGKMYIGRNGSDEVKDFFKGYIDELRISNVARWTINFTPPNAPYEIPITGQADISRKVKKIYAEDDDISRKVKKGYVGVDDISRKFFHDISDVKIVPWATGTPEEITAMLNSAYDGGINMSDYWNIGDERTIQLTTGHNIIMRVEDFNHDDLTSGGKAQVTFMIKNAPADIGSQRMNSSGYNTGGWEKCSMRTWLNGEMYNRMPEWIKSIIKPVNKKTTAGNKSTALITTSDKIWLPSGIEIYGVPNDNYYSSDEGYHYPLFADNNSRIKRYNSTAYYWWLRSPCVNNSSTFCAVKDDGNITYSSSEGYMAYILGFCF